MLQGIVTSSLIAPLAPALIKIASLAASIIGLSFLITTHEFGHFIMCKMFNVRTPRFSIGLGPTLWSKKWHETTFVVAAIPLGGFVEIAGAVEPGQGDQEHALDTDERSFIRKPYYQKILIMLGGILFNILFAYIAMIGLCYTGSGPTPLLYPRASGPAIAALRETSPFAQAGLKAGDRVLAVNGIASNRPGLTLLRDIPHDANELTFTILNPTGAEEIITVPTSSFEDRLTMRFESGPLPRSESLLEAIQCGTALVNGLTKAMVFTFYTMITQRKADGLGGPVRILAESSKSLSYGFATFLIFLALLSINLAVFNLLPLPILDGGQIVTYTIEALIGHSLPIAVRTGIHIVSWVAVLGLFVVLTIKDTLALLFS